MTSEELELSLKAEFENYLSEMLSSIRRDVAEFKNSFEAEFVKHKAQLDEAIRSFEARIGEQRPLDRGFTESIIEHLRLARDEGAQITAVAFSEAEKLQKETSPDVRYDLIRDASIAISSQPTQVTILSTLIDYASHFAPRGAFFILKGERFVGWKVYGDARRAGEKIQSVSFPAALDTIFAKAVNTLRTAESAYGHNAEDEAFLGPLEFGRPDRMYAVPLIVRGRGVAALYADYGTEGVALKLEALETLVRVAGLTVELRAAATAAGAVAIKPTAAGAGISRTGAIDTTRHSGTPHDGAYVGSSVHLRNQIDVPRPAYVSDSPVRNDVAAPQFENDAAKQDFALKPNRSTGVSSPFDTPVSERGESEIHDAIVYEEAEPVEAVEFHAAEMESPAGGDSVGYEKSSRESVTYGDVTADRFASEPAGFSDAAKTAPKEYTTESSRHTSFPARDNEYTQGSEAGSAGSVTTKPSFGSQSPVGGQTTSESERAATPGVSPAQPAAEIPAMPEVKSRLGTRGIDLPISVSEEEKESHTRARRFARLLVEEIKLYNGQKVVEGREAGDLYDRLREAIDRSREMYEKRVEPEVAAKFDYFHYEIVNNLADGEAKKLGGNYPGAAS